MNDNQEWKRLQELYASLDDVQLSQLHQQRNSLTEVAQEALAAEVRSRKLTLAEPDADFPSSIPRPDASLFELWDFNEDAIAADEALALLQRFDVTAELQPEEVNVQLAGPRSATTWKLFVAVADKERAVALLRKYKGLFPLTEADAADKDFIPGEEDMFVIAEFDVPEDAAVAENALRAADIAFKRKDESHDGQTISLFQVPQNDVDRAAELIEHAFRLMDDGSAEN